jgi:uncharacterized Zn-binding protein involved in type VI secretion
MFPAARISDLTATGDTITGPGVPNVLIGGLPASVVGDLVAGPVVASGSIVMGSFTVLISGRPAARVTSQVAGVSSWGTPVTTVVAKGAPNVLIGG